MRATYEELEQQIEAACQARIADGWTITPDCTYDSKYKLCCPMGAWLGNENLDAIKPIAGILVPFAFGRGFDGKSCRGKSKRYVASYEMGQRFRARYVTVTP